MQIRFGHEAIADFFMGELDANRTVDDPDGAANELLAHSYSRVALRLEVVGRHLKQSTPPVAFIERLARVDPARAVVVMQGAPNALDSRLKADVVSSLATEISDASRLAQDTRWTSSVDTAVLKRGRRWSIISIQQLAVRIISDRLALCLLRAQRAFRQLT